MRLLILFILLPFIGQSQIISASPPYRVTAAGVSCTLILDTYTGAAVAYSLRKLDCDYAGSAVLVRRSSDDATQAIGFTAGYDFDTAALKTFVGTGGTDDGFVVTWYDQSGNANNATQATTSLQPQIMDNGVIYRLNGLPAFEINTQNQYLAFTQVTTTRSGFMVYNSAATNSNNPPILGSSGAYDFHGLASNTLMYNTTYCSASVTGGTHYVNNTNYAAADVPKSTSQQLYSLFTSGNVTAGNISNDRIVFARSWLGQFQEVIIYTTDKSADRSGFEADINGYYGAY